MTSIKKRKKFIILLSIVLAIAALLTCAWFFLLKDFFMGIDTNPISVSKLSEILGIDSSTMPRYSGVIEPQETIKIEKDASKTVLEIHVAVGDTVQPGDILFEYDTGEMEIDLEQSKIDYEGITNRIGTLKSHLTRLNKELSGASGDDRIPIVIQIQSTEIEIKSEEINLAEKELEVEKLEKALDNSEVFSKVSGTVKEINPNEKTDISGQILPFISIVSSEEFLVKGTISELNINSISEEQEVTIHSRVDNSATWQGTILKIDRDNVAQNNNDMFGYYDSGSNRSSKYNFYVSLKSMDGLILGQHVHIEPLTVTSAKTGLWVPEFYIAYDSSNPFFWIKGKNDKLEKAKVVLGEYDEESGMFEIISGLKQGDYIAMPNEELKPGMPTITNSYDQNNSVIHNRIIDDNMPMDDGMIIGGEDKEFFPETDEDMEDEKNDSVKLGFIPFGSRFHGGRLK